MLAIYQFTHCWISEFSFRRRWHPNTWFLANSNLYYVFLDAMACLSPNENDAKEFLALNIVSVGKWQKKVFVYVSNLKFYSKMKIIHLRETQFIDFSQVKSLLSLIFNEGKNSVEFEWQWSMNINIMIHYVFFHSIFSTAIHCNRFQIKFDTKDIQSFIELKRLESSRRIVTIGAGTTHKMKQIALNCWMYYEHDWMCLMELISVLGPGTGFYSSIQQNITMFEMVFFWFCCAI